MEKTCLYSSLDQRQKSEELPFQKMKQCREVNNESYMKFSLGTVKLVKKMFSCVCVNIVNEIKTFYTKERKHNLCDVILNLNVCHEDF